MLKKVLKFGGTSVGSIDRIQHVANIIKKEHDSGNQIITIVSAMSGKTNELVKLSQEVNKDFDKRELDVLLSSGEQVTCALLAGALISKNLKAKSWMNWQIPILTEGEHSNSRIINMRVEEINKFLEKPDIELAKKFLRDKRYSWNSGMFVCKASSILNELSKFSPDIVDNCKQCLSESKVDLDFLRLDKPSFSKCSNISIDIILSN